MGFQVTFEGLRGGKGSMHLGQRVPEYRGCTGEILNVKLKDWVESEVIRGSG